MRRPWKLKAAIAGLEAQRSALGNSVVESAVSLDSVGIDALSGSERRGGRVSLACVEHLPVTRGLSSQISIRCFDDSGSGPRRTVNPLWRYIRSDFSRTRLIRRLNRRLDVGRWLPLSSVVTARRMNARPHSLTPEQNAE